MHIGITAQSCQAQEDFVLQWGTSPHPRSMVLYPTPSPWYPSPLPLLGTPPSTPHLIHLEYSVLIHPKYSVLIHLEHSVLIHLEYSVLMQSTPFAVATQHEACRNGGFLAFLPPRSRSLGYHHYLTLLHTFQLPRFTHFSPDTTHSP